MLRPLLILVAALATAPAAAQPPADDGPGAPLAGASSTAPSPGVHWLDGGLDAALAEAQRTGRQVLVYVSEPFCVACRTLEKGPLASPRVAEAVARDYAAVRLDGRSGEGPKLVERYHVVEQPALLFLRSDGREIDRLHGAPSTDRLLDLLADYRDGHGDLEVLARRAETHPLDLDLAAEVGLRYALRGDAVAAKRHYARIFAARRLLSAAPSAPARGAADVARLGRASDFHQVRPLVEADMAGALEHVESLMAGAYLALGKYLYLRGQGDHAAAIDILESLQRRFPDSPEAAEAPYHLALAHHRAGRGRRASNELRQLLRDAPHDPAMVRTVALFCLREEGADLAWGISLAEATLAEHPHEEGLWDLLAELRARNGDPAGAVAAAEQALDHSDDPGEAQARLDRFRAAAARALAEQRAREEEAAAPSQPSEPASQLKPAAMEAPVPEVEPTSAEVIRPTSGHGVA